MRRRDFIKIVAGSSIAWPLAARAQQRVGVPTVGILWHAGSVEEEGIYLTQIQQGLQALGYVEGRNIILVNTFADEQYERYSSNAAELVRRKVDVVVAVTPPAALAAQGRPTLSQLSSYLYLTLSQPSLSPASRTRAAILPACRNLSEDIYLPNAWSPSRKLSLLCRKSN